MWSTTPTTTISTNAELFGHCHSNHSSSKWLESQLCRLTLHSHLDYLEAGSSLHAWLKQKWGYFCLINDVLTLEGQLAGSWSPRMLAYEPMWLTTDLPLTDLWLTTDWSLADHWLATDWQLTDHWLLTAVLTGTTFLVIQCKSSHKTYPSVAKNGRIRGLRS